MSSFSCESVARAALGPPARCEGGELLWHCPNKQNHRNGDAHPSLKTNTSKDVWGCFVCGTGGTAWQMAAFLAGLDPSDKPAVMTWLRDHGILSAAVGESGRGGVVATYVYTDVEGVALARKLRYEPKSFSWQRCEKGTWIDGLGSVKPPVYCLPQVVAASDVMLVEGEKDADTGNELGFATTTSGGAGSWRPEFSEIMAGKNVSIIADSDEPGRKHAQQVAASLFGKVSSLKVLELPEAKDLSEWVGLGGTAEQFTQLLRAAPEWKPQRSNTTEKVPMITLATAEEFLKRTSRDERPYLVDGLLPASSQTIWQGRPKAGKSHSLLQLAFDAASGLPVFGKFPVPRPIRTCYVELEEQEGETKGRYEAMLRAHSGQGPNAPDLRFFTREDLHRLRLLPRELLGGRLKDFVAAVRDAGSELVILIALRRFVSPGQNLKDADVAERVNDALDVILEETGAAIALANHDRKGEANTVEAQGFGSTFISARADAVFDLERGEGNLRRVRSEARYAVPEQFFLCKESVGQGTLIVAAESPGDSQLQKRRGLFERVDRGESLAKAAKAAGIGYSTASRWVRDRRKDVLEEEPAL